MFVWVAMLRLWKGRLVGWQTVLTPSYNGLEEDGVLLVGGAIHILTNKGKINGFTFSDAFSVRSRAFVTSGVMLFHDVNC